MSTETGSCVFVQSCRAKEKDSMDMKRVFLKLSGEALAGPKKTGFDEDTVKEVARQVKLSGRGGGAGKNLRPFF